MTPRSPAILAHLRNLKAVSPSPFCPQAGGGFVDSSCQGPTDGCIRPARTCVAPVIHGHPLHLCIMQGTCGCRKGQTPREPCLAEKRGRQFRSLQEVQGAFDSVDLTPGLGEERGLSVRSTRKENELPLTEAGRQHLCFLKNWRIKQRPSK